MGQATVAQDWLQGSSANPAFDASRAAVEASLVERAAKALKVVLDYFNDAAHGEHTWTLPTPFENGEMAS